MQLTKNRTTPQNDPHHITQTLTVEIMPTSMTTSRPQDCFANPTRHHAKCNARRLPNTRNTVSRKHTRQTKTHIPTRIRHPFGRSVAQKNHNNRRLLLGRPRQWTRQCVTCHTEQSNSARHGFLMSRIETAKDSEETTHCVLAIRRSANSFQHRLPTIIRHCVAPIVPKATSHRTPLAGSTRTPLAGSTHTRCCVS